MITHHTSLKAKDVMTREPVCVSPTTRIGELARIFEDHEISGAPVIDQQGRLIGIVSKTDLIRRCAEGLGDIPPAYLFETLDERGEQELTSQVTPELLVCVDDFMTEGPLTVAPQTPVTEVARVMFTRRVHRVIVVDDENFPLGIITTMDLLGVFPH